MSHKSCLQFCGFLGILGKSLLPADEFRHYGATSTVGAPLIYITESITREFREYMSIT